MKYLLAVFSILSLLALKSDKKNVIGSHEEAGFVVKYSPLGNYLASGSNDNKIKIWEASTNKLIKEFAAHSVGVKDLVFTPDNKYLISAGLDNLIKVWEVGSWKLKKNLTEHNSQVLALVLSPDGKTLFSGGDDKKIILWDTKNFKKSGELDGHFDRVLSLNVSKNGKYLVSTGGDRVSKSPGNLKVWDIEKKTLAYNLEEESFAIQDAALSAKGTLVLYAGNFTDAILFKWTENKIAAKIKATSFGINSVELNGLQAYLASTYNGEIISWKIGGETKTLKTHEKDINSISLSPDKSSIASTGADGNVIVQNLN